MHLLIPFASCLSEGCKTGLDLPRLEKLLKRLDSAGMDSADDTTLSPPHERALAVALGLSPSTQPVADGQLPWGAWQAAKAGLANTTDQAWGLITPCQWAVQSHHISMTDPAALQLSAADSRALLDAMRPYFAEDGIALTFDTPTRWLARGDIFRGLATASLDRVIGRDIEDWIPKSPTARSLRRLQNEMQMLLYTHGVTEARAQRGLPVVNSFWVSGTGALTAVPPEAKPITIPVSLREAALLEDWNAWVLAWQQIDATDCAALLTALERGEPVTLTLCGERANQRFEGNSPKAPHPGWRRVLRKIGRQIRPLPSSNVLSML
jgi:hypothetical protein